MDPLSDVLSLLKPRNYLAGGIDAGGDWSIQFQAYEGIKCYAVASGEAWLSVAGVSDPVHLTTGDCFLLPSGRPFRLTVDLVLDPVDAQTIHRQSPNGGVVTYNGGGDFFIVGGFFGLAGNNPGMLLGILPPIVHIRNDADKAALRWCLDRISQELREKKPGDVLVVQQLAYLMLVQALRLHLAEGLKGGVGWLFALADRQMSVAIGAMHAEPARRWTLPALAERAGMSRTTFAVRFKETVGVSPMDYLTRWRMLLAGDRLETTDDPISVIALSLGYDSESAFSTAFKRVMGAPPRRYGRGRTPAGPPSRVEGAGALAGQLEPV